MSANFRTFFVSGISYGLILIKSFEDFQKFKKIPAYGGLDMMILVLWQL